MPGWEAGQAVVVADADDQLRFEEVGRLHDLLVDHLLIYVGQTDQAVVELAGHALADLRKDARSAVIRKRNEIQ